MSVKRLLALIGLVAAAGCGGVTNPNEICYFDQTTGLMEYCEEIPVQQEAEQAEG